MAIDISDRRELLVDDYLIDEARTTAREVMHHPVRREMIFSNDAPWEADGWAYYTVMKDDALYRMYYLCMPMYNREHTRHDPPFHHICYAQSEDGVKWEKPTLGLCEFEGSKANNIVAITDTMDAFHVFRDDNPACPAEERYKAVYTERGCRLCCMTSADGIRFRKGWELSSKGHFDSHNTAFWDGIRKVYVCNFRGFHRHDGIDIRDIRRMESPDFKHWSEAEPIRYTDERYDFHMYTNGIQPYFRAPHLYIGLPTRYTGRQEWSASYDRLCGSERRRWRMQFDPRYGLALTDGLFMTSRDLKRWNRRNEAFLRPGAESRLRWVYGDGYAAYGVVPTRTDVEGEEEELSLYASGNHWSDEPVQVWRYTLRADGFISRSAGFDPLVLTTKPIVFDGNALDLNLSTSAAGSCEVALCDLDGAPIPGYDSGEIFGDSIDRRVDFPKPLANLAGTPIILRFTLRDADLYALHFRHVSESGK